MSEEIIDRTEELLAEQKAFIGEMVVKSICDSNNQQSPIAYFKTLYEIVQWSTALHSNTQTLNIGHFDMFRIRVTKSYDLEQLFDKEPTFWEKCIRSHHRFPTFENPFPLRAKTKVYRPTSWASKLCHQ